MRKHRLLFNVAKKVLSKEEADAVIKGMDIIGDIAILKIPLTLEDKKTFLAEALLKEAPYIKTVFMQTAPTKGDYRLKELKWLAGEEKSVTTHKEYGCLFKVDVQKAFFSPRLSFERKRIAEFIKKNPVNPSETIINLFAGVGCFSILIAKINPSVKVFSIDLNPDAVQYMIENILINKVRGKVIAVLSEARKIVNEFFLNKADRVLMPLPEKAYEFLDVSVAALKLNGGFIHYQDFIQAKKKDEALKKAEEKVSEKLKELKVGFQFNGSRIIKDVAPYMFQIALDIKVSSKNT
ncbi:MAG: class I SAM-dependent methyltransferase family protein [Candidatus Bathyarchaeia archaeon]